MDAGPQKRTWLAPEARMRRLSVHGKSPEPPLSTSRTSENSSSAAVKSTPRARKGGQLESPNTPFDGTQEFSHSTSGAGGSLQSPSEVDSGSQEKRYSTISRRSSLVPTARLNPDTFVPAQDGKAALPLRPAARAGHDAQEQEPREAAWSRPFGAPIPQRPSSQPVHAGGSARSPLKLARGEPAVELHGSRPKGELQQRAHSLVERSAEGRRPGWFQNDTYGVEAAAAVPGWKRPCIAVPAYSEGSASRHLSPSGVAGSMPWPAISPKEAVTPEQEAWYIEQVAVALGSRERAVETIQALLRSCRANTVSSAAAMQQVASLLSGHPILIEGFTAFLPDKTAFFQADGHPGNPAQPLKGTSRDLPSAEGAPLMAGAHARSSAMLTAEQPHAERPARRAKAQTKRTNRGGSCWQCGCWQHIKAARKAGVHLPWWTVAFCAASLGVFLYMAGNYGTFHLVQLSIMDPDQRSAQSPEEQAQLLGFTPTALRAWFRAVPGWRSFDGAYLAVWGGRYLPDLAHTHWWLWATSGLLHTDFMHLAGSLVPWAVLACLLELNYGSIRVVVLWLVSLLGGAFTSAVLDPSCQVVVGCNGALMGMLPWLFGAFLADFRASSSQDWLRLLLAAAAILLHLVIAILQRDASYHSNWADLGGFLCGLLPAVLFLPCPSDARWATAKRLLSGAGRRCMLCCCCDCCKAQRAVPAEVALADMAPPGGGQQPLQAPVPVAAMQEPETLQSPQGAGDISLDMPRLYSKHQLPALSYYDKSLRSQWDIEQALEPRSARAESIPAHREGGLLSQSPTAHYMEARSRQASPHEGSPLAGSSAGRALRSSADPANALGHEGHVQNRAEAAGEESPSQAGRTEGARSCCCCSCAGLAHGVFCLFSAVASLGILVGAPVYMYLVKLPSLACGAAA